MAIAVKHTVPQSVTRTSSIATAEAAAAARHRLGAPGPDGTARKPTAAVKMTAVMLNKQLGNRSERARHRTTAASPVKAAITAAVIVWPAAPLRTPDHTNATAPAALDQRHAAPPMIRAARSPSPVRAVTLATVSHSSATSGSGVGMSVVPNTNSAPSRTSFSLSVIDSSSEGPPTCESRQPRAAASAGQRESRRAMSTIDGINRAT